MHVPPPFSLLPRALQQLAENGLTLDQYGPRRREGQSIMDRIHMGRVKIRINDSGKTRASEFVKQLG